MLHVLHVTDERTRDTDRRGHETDAFNATRTADRLKEGTEQLALPDLSELSASANSQPHRVLEPNNITPSTMVLPNPLESVGNAVIAAACGAAGACAVLLLQLRCWLWTRQLSRDKNMVCLLTR